LNNEWIRKPKYDEPQIDENDIDDKTASYINSIDKLDEESNKELSLDEIDNYFNYAKKLKNKIHSDRKEGLATKDAEFSVENLVFKELRNTGYFGKLIKIIDKLYDKQYVQ
jgi:hypothetical protein